VVVLLHLLHLVEVVPLPLLHLVVVVLPLLLVAVVHPLLLVVVVPLLLPVAVVAHPLLRMLEIEAIYLVQFRLLIREVYEKHKRMIKVHLRFLKKEQVQLAVVVEEALVVEAEAVE
jgi:hypothetical protein